MTKKLIHSVQLFDGSTLTPNSWALLDAHSAVTGQGDSWEQHQAGAEVVDGKNQVLLSSLFDTHCHGAMGHAAQNGLEGMRATLDFNYAKGVGISLLSLVSAAPSDVIDLCEQAMELREDPRFLGLHLEGPYIAQSKRGAHNPEIIGPPTTSDLKTIAGFESVRSITIAPELFETSQLDILQDAGIKLCFGHSDAGYEQSLEFFTRYPDAVMTHAFNGMHGIHHRAPGPIPAAIETAVSIELIADGIHVLPAAAMLLPSEKLVLITDAMEATGMPDGDYQLGSMVAHVSDGVARTDSGSLAGSTLVLKDAVANYAAWSNDPLAALRAATTNPATNYGAKLPELSLANHLLLAL